MTLNLDSLDFIIDLSRAQMKFHLLSSSRKERAMSLEKAGLVQIIPLRDELSDTTANWTLITEQGKKALETCVDQLNIYVEMIKQ